MPCLRQRSATCESSGSGSPLNSPLTVDTLEILGADNLAHGRWGDQKLVVRLAHQQRPAAGSTLWLHLPEHQRHLFDGETGQRV